MEAPQESQKDPSDNKPPSSTSSSNEQELLEVVIRKIAVRNLRKSEGVKCVIKCGNFEHTTRVFRKSKADNNCLLCIELITLTAPSVFNEVSLEAWKYTEKYPQGKAIGGIKITVSDLVSENWLTLMGFSKLMKRDTFKGNMFLFAVPKDQEKFTRITMQNIRAKQLQLQELQGAMGHHQHPHQGQGGSHHLPPHYTQGILGPSEAQESNKHHSSHGKEDRFEARQISVVVQNNTDSRQAYYLSSSGHSVIRHPSDDDEGDEDDDDDERMQYYQGYGVIDRMHDLSLRGSADDSSMDEHTALLVQQACEVMDNHLSNIRMLLSSLPYSLKVMEDLRSNYSIAEKTIISLKKIIETIDKSDLELKMNLAQIYQTKHSDLTAAKIAIDAFERQNEKASPA